MASSSTSGELSADWVYSPETSVHVCNHRGWFTDYSDYSSSVLRADGSIMGVEGIGTVILKVARAGTKRRHAKLGLQNVLHVPLHICNIIGSPIKEDYEVSLAEGSFPLPYKGTIRSKKYWGNWGFFAPGKPYYQLVLMRPPTGPKLGPTVLHVSGLDLNVFRDETERQRWAGTTSRSNQSTNQTSEGLRIGLQGSNLYQDLGDLSLEEKQESKDGTTMPGPKPSTLFARSTPLSYSTRSGTYVSPHPPVLLSSTPLVLEKTAKELLPLPRADSQPQPSFSAISQPVLPEKILFGGDHIGDNHSEESLSSVDDMDYMVDHLFDKETLAWINKIHGNTRKYMEAFALNPYSKEDCQKAVNSATSAARGAPKDAESVLRQQTFSKRYYFGSDEAERDRKD